MPRIQKQKLFGLLIFTAVLIALLAISLPHLEMQPGEIFSIQSSDPIKASNPTTEDADWFFLLIQGFLVFLIILLPVHIILSLLSKAGIRKLIFDLLRFAAIFLIVAWLSKNELPFALPSESIMLQPGFSEPSEVSGITNAPPSFEADPQPWMLAVTMVGAAALLAVIAFWVLRFLSKRRPARPPEFKNLADKAQAALEAIEADQFDFNDVVIRCYAEMSQTLHAENGVQRHQAMTTHEFEQELLARGFPAKPIQQLTYLFEQVRYGRQKPRENDKRLAMESLSEIVAFCRGQA